MIAIVGGGLSGLYAAWLLSSSRGRKGKVHVYESSSTLGGRARQLRFGKTLVPGGAGVGRFEKDRRLMRLLRSLRVPYKLFPQKVGYRSSSTHIASCPRVIRRDLARVLNTRPRNKSTMAQHMTRVLGKAKMRRLVECLGYGDDLKADAADTIKDYGYDDNWQGRRNKQFVRIPWNMLIHMLVKKLRQRGVRIHTRHPIRKLSQLKPARAILLATTIDQTRRILRRSRVRATLLDTYVRSQPFLYAYGNTAPGVPPPLKSYTVTGGVIQKMIPMANGVIMMAYADNANALRLKDMPASEIASIASRISGLPLAAPYMKHFIREGTHYFRPYDRRQFPTRAHLLRAMNAELNKAQTDAQVRVIGEAVSEHHQGWVEGALEAAQRGVSQIQKF
jgi:phytoene dehydrogenase-like protein